MIKRLRNFAGLTALLLLLAAQSPAATYEVDPVHSSVGFKVRHLVVSNVRGHFDTFAGSYEFEEGEPASWSVSATVDAGSVNTGNEKRDGHLRSADFFDVEKHPTLSFTSKRAESRKGGGWALVGDLTIHGVTHEVAFDLEYNGSVKDPWGGTRTGFTATTTIDREDYGLTWNKVIESGGLTVGKEVEITLEVEGVAKG